MMVRVLRYSALIGAVLVSVASLAFVSLALTPQALAGPVEDGDRLFASGQAGAAIRLWTPPATQGDANAQYRIAMAYLSGNGVAQDRAMGLDWLEQAASRHHVLALLGLAALRSDPKSGDYDPDKAIAFLKDAASQGNVLAQRQLGQIYRKGALAGQDFDAAFAWFKRAAAQGDLASQGGLAELYRYGYGVDQDMKRAFMWASIASTSITDNDPDRIAAARAAAKARDELSRVLSPEEKKEAQALAEACWQSHLQQCE